MAGMSTETGPVLRHVDLPPGPGTKVVLVVPSSHEWLDGADPLVPGCGFTLKFGDYGMWRAEVEMTSEFRGEVGMQLEIVGRYPEADANTTDSRN